MSLLSREGRARKESGPPSIPVGGPRYSAIHKTGLSQSFRRAEREIKNSPPSGWPSSKCLRPRSWRSFSLLPDPNSLRRAGGLELPRLQHHRRVGEEPQGEVQAQDRPGTGKHLLSNNFNKLSSDRADYLLIQIGHKTSGCVEQQGHPVEGAGDDRGPKTPSPR